ncbi:hypothetical protein Salat_1393400 [Sesamum alatum]|uniref:Uncharacterized protein n=1 Tax=Sesamum alatum TaxID=300844 RepID=A0AAE1Y9L9_9LAMI|nr:hypothetical protein Salat_1393400 [Sesamum alatum]
MVLAGGCGEICFPPRRVQAFLKLSFGHGGALLFPVSAVWVEARLWHPIFLTAIAFRGSGGVAFYGWCFFFSRSKGRPTTGLIFSHGYIRGFSNEILFGTLVWVLMETKIKHLGCALRLTEDEGSGLRLSEDLWDETTDDIHMFLWGVFL